MLLLLRSSVRPETTREQLYQMPRDTDQATCQNTTKREAKGLRVNAISELVLSTFVQAILRSLSVSGSMAIGWPIERRVHLPLYSTEEVLTKKYVSPPPLETTVQRIWGKAGESVHAGGIRDFRR